VTLIPPRREIAVEYTWNAAGVFPTREACEDELKVVLQEAASFEKFRGRLADGPAMLVEAFEALERLMLRGGKVYVYATMAYNVDTTDLPAGKLLGQAQGMYGQLFAAIAFFDPELIVIGQPALNDWLKTEPRLERYAHYLDDVLRKQAHTRPAEVEEVLGLLKETKLNIEATFSLLTNADFKFEAATAGDGGQLPLAQGTLGKLLSGPDREARRTAWENYNDLYLTHKNTLANNLISSLKLNALNMRARRHDSTLALSLFEFNIPVEVFHNLIAVFRKNLPTWHRYWAIRRKALGVETLHPYDIWAPLTPSQPAVPYTQAVDWICEGLKPLGDDYVAVMRRGCLEDRWVDIYPNQGKTNGAFSSGWPGTHPFILMSYNDNLLSMSTLAHELGHSLHSYLAWQTQPVVYSQYSLFVAEVASNFHQAMTRAWLLDHKADPAFQISLIEEAMSNFHRYFFVMPILARFELEAHQRIERGGGLTAGDLISLMTDLFAEGYGNEMHVDRDRVGITWATFPHLYEDYYVYQYATGIAAAHALAGRILSQEPGAANDYLRFLKAGNSLYPLDALKLAGVDMTQPDAVEAGFKTLAGLVDRLEKLL
jgi:oligoendopeptidase F